MFYQRSISKQLLEVAQTYPIVTLLGPRQSGKTTLVKYLFAHKPYVNFEEHENRVLAENDPRRFLSQYPEGAIFDEIQRVPNLFSYIQVNVDNDNKLGKFILTGSQQLQLHQSISQSLAGRTAIFYLLPFTINELANDDLSIDEYLLQGFFPRVHVEKQNPNIAYRSYVQTYIERDLREMINIKDLHRFQQFIRLCAGRIGCVLNYDSFSNDLGVSGATIKNWISILEASFIVFLLPPYFENFGKRVLKSPKLYFTDTGLASYLLGIENSVQLFRDPTRGFLIENLVLMELVKIRYNKGLDPQLYYYRDSRQNEIDIIHKSGNLLVPIEVKASQTFNIQFLKGLKHYNKIVPTRIDKQFLVYSGENEHQIENINIINFKNVAQILN